MTLIAFAFLQHRRLALAKRGKKIGRAATPAELASGAASDHRAQATGILPSLPTAAQPAAP